MAIKLRANGQSGCYVRDVKQAIEELNKQNQTADVHKEDYRNNELMAKAFKELMSYLYD